MNKIYKVVWNKARNCYVVGSEFISSHSTGKTSTIGSKSLKTLLAVFAVCGVMYAGSSDVFAANNDAGIANKGNYIAIKASSGTESSIVQYQDEKGKHHNYKLTEVKYTDNSGTKGSQWYYVREGYYVELDQDKRHSETSKDDILRVYKQDPAAE